MNFDEIISDIISDTKDETSQTIANDEQIISATVNETKEYTQYGERDRLYSELLDHYIAAYKSKNAWNKVYKCIFFFVAMTVFVLLIIGAVVLFGIIAYKDSTSVSDIALVVGAVASIISAIIVLPKIIAKHLFPTNEDKHMIDMVKNMQVNDSSIRTTINKK